MDDGIGIEQALIGTVVVTPRLAEEVMDIKPQDFSCQSHQAMWTEIIGLHRSGALTTRALIEVMKSRGTLKSAGHDIEDGSITGEMYVQEILTHRSEPSVRKFADMVLDASTKRDLRSFGQLLALDAESEEEAEAIIEKAEERLFELRRRKMDTGVDIGDLLLSYDTIMDKWRAGELQPAFRFASTDLKKLLPFLEESDFLIVAGRPGEAKSSFVRYEAFEAARRGQKVAIFNLENGEIEYARYLIAYITGINTMKLRSPEQLSLEEVEQVKSAIRTLRSLPLRIVTMGAPSVRELTAVAGKLVRDGYQVIIVDYIQLIRNGLKDEVQDITTSSSILRGFALKYKVPVIAAAQLNRNIVHRKGEAGGNGALETEPDLSDLRGSGSLEQDAVQVIFTRVVATDDAGLRQFPENLGPSGQLLEQIRVVPMRMFVKKSRNGAVGKTNLIKWDKAVNRFYPLTLP